MFGEQQRDTFSHDHPCLVSGASYDPRAWVFPAILHRASIGPRAAPRQWIQRQSRGSRGWSLPPRSLFPGFRFEQQAPASDLRFVFAAFELLSVEHHVLTARLRGIQETSFFLHPRASVAHPGDADERASRAEVLVRIRVHAVPFSFVSFRLAGADLVLETAELAKVPKGVSVACFAAPEDLRKESEVVDIGDEYPHEDDQHQWGDALESMFLPWVDHRGS